MFPRFEQTKFLDQLVERIDRVKAMLAFLPLDQYAVLTYEKTCRINRIRYALLINKIKLTEEEVRSALNGDSSDEIEKNSAVLSIQKAEKYLDRLSDYPDIRQLQKAHEILLRHTPNAHYGGMIREGGEENKNLYRAPSSAQLNRWIDFLVQFPMKESNIHPFLKAWSLYLLFDIIRPFSHANENMGILMLYQVLKRDGYYLNHFWALEKYLFNQLEAHESSKFSTLFETGFEERLENDITPFLETAGREGEENLNQIEAWIRQTSIESAGDQIKNPLSRNSFNYFLESGFIHKYRDLTQLTDRQKGILLNIVQNRDVSTKSMSMEYRCDRKTIQRDFQELLNRDLICVEGKTKTIRYRLNFAYN